MMMCVSRMVDVIFQLCICTGPVAAALALDPYISLGVCIGLPGSSWIQSLQSPCLAVHWARLTYSYQCANHQIVCVCTVLFGYCCISMYLLRNSSHCPGVHSALGWCSKSCFSPYSPSCCDSSFSCSCHAHSYFCCCCSSFRSQCVHPERLSMVGGDGGGSECTGNSGGSPCGSGCLLSCYAHSQLCNSSFEVACSVLC
jgi:hypothetical protein